MRVFLIHPRLNVTELLGCIQINVVENVKENSLPRLGSSQITIDIHRMFLNVIGMSWLSQEHMYKCGYQE